MEKHRIAVLAPDEFESSVREGVSLPFQAAGSIRFSRDEDMETVVSLYAEGFLKLLGAAERLDYSEFGWGGEKLSI